MTALRSISIVIPTYRRGEALLQTMDHLLGLNPPPLEMLVVDQTPEHPPSVQGALNALAEAGRIRLIRLDRPSIPASMNRGLLEAKGRIVLYLDDDVVPSPGLVAAHAARYAEGVAAVCGQVLQPGETPGPNATGSERGTGLRRDLGFRFNGTEKDEIASVISCNLSVDRTVALAIGGFDEQFIGSAYRYETDFARRLIAVGHRILFAPEASVHHLRLPTGGTRSAGDHLRHPSPLHAVGDYYFALRHGRPVERTAYMLRRLRQECLNRYYAGHPWRLPSKLATECLALRQARRLARTGPSLLGTS